MAGIDAIANALASTEIQKGGNEALVSFSDGIQRKLNSTEDGKLSFYCNFVNASLC